jgi:gluconate 2-dehydrogenase gamma chain
VSGLTRREALSVLGSIPVAAALGVSPAAAERAIRVAQAAAAEIAAGRPSSYEPVFFTAHEWRTVRVLVDMILPADERSGSATDAGVPEFMDFTLDDRPNMRNRMRGGLAWLDTESRRRHGAAFADATDAQRGAILDDIAYPARARPELSHGVTFFTFVRDFTASGFFSSETGFADLGYQGNRMVREWEGCPPEALARLGVSYDLMRHRVDPQR